MDNKHLMKAMARVSPKAVNEMLTRLAAGVFAGRLASITGAEAARMAIECAEKLLAVTLASDGDDD